MLIIKVLMFWWQGGFVLAIFLLLSRWWQVGLFFKGFGCWQALFTCVLEGFDLGICFCCAGGFWWALGCIFGCSLDGWGGLGVDAGVCMWFVICICQRQYSFVPFLFFGWFLRGFCWSHVCTATNFPLCVFFFPPELISASCTGLLVNNICQFKKK